MSPMRMGTLAIGIAAALGSAAASAQYANISINSSFPTYRHQGVATSLVNTYHNNYGFYLPNGRVVHPYNEVIATVSTINPGTDAPNVLAYTYITPYKGPICFDGYGAGTQAVLMEAVLHEGDHHIYGSHTCGGSADTDDNGPFGATSYYMLKLVHLSSTLNAAQRNQAASNALYRASANICQQAAKDRIYNAYFNNAFPQMCYYDESGQVCSTDPGSAPPTLPPPPQCYYDESGEICINA
jgi:hypothetical protein